MRKLIFATLLSLLLACTNDDVLHANLTMVNDKKEMRKDEMGNDVDIRSISVHYLAINKSNDSIFIPIGYPYENSVTVNIKSKESLKISKFYREDCMQFNGYRGHYRPNYFATGDSISILFLFHIYPINSNDSEWLRNVSTKELMSKIELKMGKPTKGKDIDKIPNIIFINDTNDICINPVLKTRKNGLENSKDRRDSGDHFSTIGGDSNFHESATSCEAL